MTKSTKKKKEKSADFTKRKLKLGKGKQLATNAVDTSFKARSIALPQQSITTTNEISAPTTRRKLTLDALLTQLKHYGAGVRKDALQGLHELLSEHPTLVEQNLSRLINSCVRLINDEDASVRKALHSFLAWLLPRVSRESLLPYASTLLLFTASAQSHIFLEIRLDAIRLLDLLLEFIPEQVVAGFWNNDLGGNRVSHGRKVLDGYLSLLNVGVRFGESEGIGSGSSSGVGGQSTTSVSLGNTAKATVLNSFANFLRYASGRQSQERSTQDSHRPGESIPLWYLSESFSSHDAFTSFASLFSLQCSTVYSQNNTRIWTEEDGEDDYTGSFPLSSVPESSDLGENVPDVESLIDEIGRLADGNTSSNGLSSHQSYQLVPLCRALHPVLISTFLDCAPSVFSPTQASSEVELELVRALLEIARCTYGRLLRDTNISWDQKQAACKDLEAFLVHLSVYFPFGENRMVALDIKTEDTFRHMNLVYCELFSLRSLNHLSGSQEEVRNAMVKRRKLNHPQSSKPDRPSMADASSARQTDLVREYVVRCLHGTGSSASANAHPLGQSLTAQTYMGLLPTLWWLLNRPDDESASEVLEAVLEHAVKAGSTSGVKPVATEFVGRLILVQTESSYAGSFKAGPFMSHDLQKMFRDWLHHLPKVLWELGDKNQSATEMILLFILRLLQRRSWLTDVETCTALCTRYAPFFTIQHATRGELRGPYARLDTKSTAILPEISGPKNVNARTSSTLKKLALNVAAVLVSTTSEPLRAAPRKKFLRAGRRADDTGRLTKIGSDPVSGMGSLVEAQAALRRAVDKAVSRTTEEVYWLGVSRV